MEHPPLTQDVANRYAVLELRTSEPPMPPLASSHSSSRALLPSALASPSTGPSRSHSRAGGIRSLKERSSKAIAVTSGGGGGGSAVAAAIAASTLDEHFDSRLQYLVAEISGRIRNEVLATTAESASQAVADAARAAASVAETSNKIFVGLRSELDERLRQLDERVALLAQQQAAAAGGGGAVAGDAAAGALALVQGELRELGGAVREMQVQQQAAVSLAQQALAAAEAQAASLAKVQAEAATAAATQAAALAKVQADVEEQAAAVGAAQMAAEAAQKDAAEVARGMAIAASVVSGGMVSAADAAGEPLASCEMAAAPEPAPAAAAAAVPPLSRGASGSRSSQSRGASGNLSRNSASGQVRTSDTGSSGGARRSGSNLPLQPSVSMQRNEQQQQMQQQMQQQQQAMADGLDQLRAMVMELQQQVVLELRPQQQVSYQQMQQELLRVREDAQRAAQAAVESASAAAAAMAVVATATGAVAAADGVAVVDVNAVLDGGVTAANGGAGQEEEPQLAGVNQGYAEGAVQEQQGAGVEGAVDAVARVGSSRSSPGEAAEEGKGADGAEVGGRPPLGSANASRAGSKVGSATAAELQAAVERMERQLTALGARVAEDISQLQEQVTAAAAAAPTGAAARATVASATAVGDGGGDMLLDADAGPAEVRAAVNAIHGQLVNLTASFGATAELAAKAHSAAVTAAALSGGGAAVGDPALTIEALVSRISALEVETADAATQQQQLVQQQLSYQQVQQELLRVREDAQKAAQAAVESASAAAAAMAAVATATGAVAAADGVAVADVNAVLDGGVTAANGGAEQGEYQQYPQAQQSLQYPQLQQEQEAVSAAAAAAAAPEVVSRARESMEVWSAFLRERGIEPLSAALPRPYTYTPVPASSAGDGSVSPQSQQLYGGSLATGQPVPPVPSSDGAFLGQEAGGRLGQVSGTGEPYSASGPAPVGASARPFLDAAARLAMCDMEVVLGALVQELKQVQDVLQASGGPSAAGALAAVGGAVGAVAGVAEASEMQQVVQQQAAVVQELQELQQRVAAAEAAAEHAAETADDIGSLPDIMHNGLTSLTQQLEEVRAEQQQLLASVSPQLLQGLAEEVAALRAQVDRAEEAASEARATAAAAMIAKEAAEHDPEALALERTSTPGTRVSMSGAGRTSLPGVPSRASSSGAAGRMSNAGRISTVFAIPEGVEGSGGSEVGGPGTPEQVGGAAARPADAATVDVQAVMAEVQRRLDNLACEVRANMDQLSTSLISEVEGARTETAIMISREVASQLAAGRAAAATGGMHNSESGVPSRALSSASVGREEGMGMGMGVDGGGVDGAATEATLRALQERVTSMEQELGDVCKEVADVCKAADMTTESVELLTKHVQVGKQSTRDVYGGVAGREIGRGCRVWLASSNCWPGACRPRPLLVVLGTSGDGNKGWAAFASPEMLLAVPLCLHSSCPHARNATCYAPTQHNRSCLRSLLPSLAHPYRPLSNSLSTPLDPQNIEQVQNQAHDALRNQVDELTRNAQQGAAAVAQRAAARRSATGDAPPLAPAQPPPADNDLIDALAELHFQLTELQVRNNQVQAT